MADTRAVEDHVVLAMAAISKLPPRELKNLSAALDRFIAECPNESIPSPKGNGGLARHYQMLIVEPY